MFRFYFPLFNGSVMCNLTLKAFVTRGILSTPACDVYLTRYFDRKQPAQLLKWRKRLLTISKTSIIR